MPTSFDALDPRSRLLVRIFAVKLVVIIPVAVPLATRGGYSLLGILSLFCLWHSFFAGTAALLQRQKHGAPFLTAWDEMAAFLAIAVLMRLAGATMA
jgi:hypothetical protein